MNDFDEMQYREAFIKNICGVELIKPTRDELYKAMEKARDEVMIKFIKLILAKYRGDLTGQENNKRNCKAARKL